MIVQVYSHSHVVDRYLFMNERSNVDQFCFFHLLVGDVEAICSESCGYSKDGTCNDGGSGSDYDDCAFGTDCEVGLLEPITMTYQKQLWCCVRTFFKPFFFQTLSSDGRTVADAQAT